MNNVDAFLFGAGAVITGIIIGYSLGDTKPRRQRAIRRRARRQRAIRRRARRQRAIRRRAGPPPVIKHKIKKKKKKKE